MTTTTHGSARITAPGYAVPRQATFDDLGRQLRDVTFVVVDLETTGGSPHDSEITEIGAVKVRAGEVIGEMATLVRPMTAIPPFIAVLTGITDAMVAGSPPVAAVLPAFLEFSRGAVLVAHNAPFDLGFLRAACERHGMVAPAWEHVDTARLARKVLTRDEAPNCKLSSLARLFRTTTEPCHRALADARATVDVLHGLFERVGNLGVHTLEDLHEFSARVPDSLRRKRHLADGLPEGPGVYVFRDASGRALYVGTSRSVRSRVRSYFTGSEQRTRMAEMVGLAERVDAIACAHTLEASVRELRLIAEHKPPYNRRSRFPERVVYLKVTAEAFPRLSMVRLVRADACTYLGPFASVRSAEAAAAALHEAIPLRQCGGRLSARRLSAACALADLGRCNAPCDGRESVADYARHTEAATVAITSDPGTVVDAALRRIERLAEEHRYEDAAVQRDRATAFLRAASRLQRLTSLGSIPGMTAACPTGAGGWDLTVIRHGRLAAAGTVGAGIDPRPWVDALEATAETVRPGPLPTPAASAEEMECLLGWLSGPGARLVRLDGTWASPARGAAGELARGRWHAGATVDPFTDQRRLRPSHRPARGSR